MLQPQPILSAYLNAIFQSLTRSYSMKYKQKSVQCPGFLDVQEASENVLSDPPAI
jgi:hypothetical protein